MTTTHLSKDAALVSEKYPLLLQGHPAMMNAYPTTATSLFSRRHRQDTSPSSLDASEYKTSRVDRPGVPLRQRLLPASFWKEPNVPRHPFFPPWFGHVPLNRHHQMFDYQEFIDRLESSRIAGLPSFGSRFPITEFLYHNYGMKDRSDHSLTQLQDTLWPLGPLQHKKESPLSVPGSHLCPYLGCNCATTGRDSAHERHDGSARVNPSHDMLQASLWKPVPTKSLSSYPTRFHPFAHAR